MSTSYIHGTSPTEQQRLSRMQELLNAAELAQLELGGVRRLVDFGSGLGQMTRAFARTLGAGARVVGIERDERQLATARVLAEAAGEAALAELRGGDAEAPPLAAEEQASFDLAHARFLLEHVPDPLAVVRAMVAAVRPGGRVVLVDDDHELLRLWPASPPLEEVWRLYWESYRDRGTDPLVGRRLAELLLAAGAEPCRATTIFFGATRGSERFDLVVENLRGVLDGAAAELASSGRVPREQMNDALRALETWRQGAHATIWYSIPLVEGRRR